MLKSRSLKASSLIIYASKLLLKCLQCFYVYNEFYMYIAEYYDYTAR